MCFVILYTCLCEPCVAVLCVWLCVVCIRFVCMCVLCVGVLCLYPYIVCMCVSCVCMLYERSVRGFLLCVSVCVVCVRIIFVFFSVCVNIGVNVYIMCIGVVCPCVLCLCVAGTLPFVRLLSTSPSCSYSARPVPQEEKPRHRDRQLHLFQGICHHRFLIVAWMKGDKSGV